jgi:hypothetical protein
MLLSAPASAAPPWSSPEVAQAGRSAQGPAWLTFGRSDAGVAAWSTDARRFAVGNPGDTAIAAVRGARPAGVRTMSTGIAPPAAYGTTRVLHLRAKALAPSSARPRVRLGVSFGRTSGAVGTFRTLDDVRLASDPAIAVNAAGDAVAAWAEARGDRTLLWIARRRAGGDFGSPQVIRGSGRVSALAVAVGRGRHFVVAYQRSTGSGAGSRVEARFGGVGGGPRALHDLGRAHGLSQVAAGVAPSGRTTVAWGTQDAGEEANRPFETRAAVKVAGARRFRSPVVLDRATEIDRPQGHVRVAVADDGTATVAWPTVVGTGQPGDAARRYPIRIATQDARARFRVWQEVAPSGALGGLAVRSDGVAAVTWSRFAAGGPPVATGVDASVRASAAGRFEPAESVSDAAPLHLPDLRFTGRSGRPVVAWTARPAGQGAAQVLLSARTL